MRGEGGISEGAHSMDFLLVSGEAVPGVGAHRRREGRKKLLKQRLKQVERPGFVGPKEEKWTLADMKAQNQLTTSERKPII